VYTYRNISYHNYTFCTGAIGQRGSLQREGGLRTPERARLAGHEPHSRRLVRKLEPGLTDEEAREDIVAPGTWAPLVPDLDLMESGWTDQDRYGFSFRDALIVAAARRLGCAVLLTEDLSDGQDLGGLVVRNPFTTPPG
jgi:hypothetical protein